MSRTRTYKFLILPNVRQKTLLEELLERQCELYNAALEERRGAWAWEKRSVSYFEQTKTLTQLREFRPELLANGVTVCRGTLKRLDRAFGAFYRRVRLGQTPGYPRFQSRTRFDSAEWEDRRAWTLDISARRLRLLGIGHIKVNLHHQIRGTPKAITIKRAGRRFWLSVRCTDVPAEVLPKTGKSVGIDLGVKNLFATSEGLLIANDRVGKRHAEKLANAQRSLERKIRGSAGKRKAYEKVASCHRKIRNSRHNRSHQLSRQLVNNFDLIVVEDLRIKNMIRRPRPVPLGDGKFAPNGASAKSNLNRSIADAGWGQLIAMITYKAESAGRDVIAINPRHTSQTCNRCGHVDKGNRISQARFCCLSCGHVEHADVNAAINILWAGRAQQASACVGLHATSPTTGDLDSDF